MNREPDSDISPDQKIQVSDTPDHDNPAFGSVTVTMDLNKTSSTTLRMSRATAESLLVQLENYLHPKCPACKGTGSVRELYQKPRTCRDCNGTGARQ